VDDPSHSQFVPDALLALAGTLLIASADEFHQSSLPNRTASAWDVLIDGSGAFTLQPNRLGQRDEARPLHTIWLMEVFETMVPRNFNHNWRWFAKSLTLALGVAIPQPAQARLVSWLSYRELLAKSDLVVIANPLDKTADTEERSVLPGISQQHEDGTQSKIESVGVETPFTVLAVLKGNPTIKRFTLHHYREAESHGALSINGPLLVTFDPSNASERRSYLMFLTREPDGRFAPVGGQTDPGMQAICSIPFQPQ